MLARIFEVLGIAQGGEQEQRLALVGQLLAMLEGHVKEAAPFLRHAVVIAARDRFPGYGQSEMIGGELVRMAPEHVARELVEQDHGGERGLGVTGEIIGLAAALPRPFDREALAYLFVQRRVLPPPVIPAEREPEVQDGADPGLPTRVGHAAVPPTVSPSISRVGW